MALVQSGQRQRVRIWYQFQQENTNITKNTSINSLYVLQNGKATTYTLPTGKQKLTLAQADKLSSTKLVALAKRKDRQAYQQGVKEQQARIADTIAGIKTDIKTVQQQNSTSQVATLQRYLKVNQSIHDNPSAYSAPKSYRLTAALVDKGEQFDLKQYTVKTVQYGDANIIMNSESQLSNLTYTKKLAAKRYGTHYYAGYRADITGMHYQLLTRTAENTRVVFDKPKGDRVTNN